MSSQNSDKLSQFDEQKLKECVIEVKAKLRSHDISIPSHCDLFIARCVRVKTFDSEKAAQLVMNFGDMMKMSAMQDLYGKFKPSECKHLYLNGTITPLLQRDSLGRLIIVARTATWNPNEFDFDQALAAFIVLMNYCVAISEKTQCSGVVFVLDFSDWTLQQVRSIKLGRLKLVVKLMQNSSPAKIKGIHLINHPKVITVMFLLVKSFLKAKLATRIHFHGCAESLDSVFGPHFLSETMNGIRTGNTSVVDMKLLSELSQRNAYYQEMIKSGYPSY